MKVILGNAATLCCVALLIGVRAQAVGVMATSGQDKMSQDKMSKVEGKDISYTGCLETGAAPRTYVLTHVAAVDDQMGKDAMAKDAMGNSAMPATLSLSSQAVDLSTHVGHKVTVIGTTPGKMDAMKKDSMGKNTMAQDTMAKNTMAKNTMAKDSTGGHGHAFNVTSLTMIASSCQ